MNKNKTTKGLRTMRLIDADLLMQNLGFDDTEEERDENVGMIITWEDVDRMPTAYDMDKVVMCLDGRAEDCREKGRKLEEAGIEDTSRKMYAKAYSYEEAINIVKGGGVDQRNDVKTNGNQAKILDVTCGLKTIWFNKNHPAAVYCDIRKEKLTGIWKSERGKSERICYVDPDIQCDFTDLPFQDGSFSLVVFDPPHLRYAGETGWLVKKYGKLDEHWPEMLHDGFQECMRVLKEDGVLIFKWAETDISAQKVWKAIGQKPLFGHHSGKRSGTFWGCYMKGQE